MRSCPKAVVVLAGARDHYQLPLALHEGQLLQALVTDMYWPLDKRWFSSSLGLLLGENIVSARFCRGLASTEVKISKSALCAFASMKIAPQLNINRVKDKALSRKARRLAYRDHAALFCYNYYAYQAFKEGTDRARYRFLFQLQADSSTLRRILLEEMERTPMAKKSLESEYELSLPEKEFEELRSEAHLANGLIATSTFAAKSLAERGIPSGRIHVVPYGVDSTIFPQRPTPPDFTKPFKVVYIGSLIQRKGISYLLDGIRLLKSRNLRVTLCVHGFIDKHFLESYADLDIDIKLGLSGKSLAYEIRSSDVFVFPSLAEGFGLVILEAMSCGLPIITTSHTGAPDVMADGEHGFIVPIRDAEAIAEKLIWGIDHRADLAEMGEAAAKQARLFSWERFKAGVREAYEKMVASAR